MDIALDKQHPCRSEAPFLLLRPLEIHEGRKSRASRSSRPASWPPGPVALRCSGRRPCWRRPGRPSTRAAVLSPVMVTTWTNERPSGGDTPNATYRNHGDHAEAVEIVFD